MCEPVKLAGTRGAYAVTVKRRPCYVTDKCTGCSDCAKATETLAPNAYNYDLDKVLEAMAGMRDIPIRRWRAEETARSL